MSDVTDVNFSQCLPIEENALSSELMNLSIKRSRLWPHFTVFRLSTNLRLNADQQSFAHWLLEVGEGRNLTGPDGQEELPPTVLSSGDLIEEVYGEMLRTPSTLCGTQLKDYLSGRCILSVLNEVCNWYNNAVIERMSGQAREYLSIDETIVETGADAPRQPVELLNSLDIPGIPPHKLRLKRNSVVMLLRNLQVSEGLCNGKLHTNLVFCTREVGLRYTPPYPGYASERAARRDSQRQPQRANSRDSAHYA